jgi:hypothetical protein
MSELATFDLQRLPNLSGNMLTISFGTEDRVSRMKYTLSDLTYITKQGERLDAIARKADDDVDI